jgi:NADH:ubiquinone oxidoreductase subunit F (NADH-binding)
MKYTVKTVTLQWKSYEMTADEVVEVKKSGLRGRGGAGFPAEMEFY